MLGDGSDREGDSGGGGGRREEERVRPGSLDLIRAGGSAETAKKKRRDTRSEEQQRRVIGWDATDVCENQFSHLSMLFFLFSLFWGCCCFLSL